MSKPINEHNINVVKSFNADNNIRTAPDGRLIIVDEPLTPLPKCGKIILFYYIYQNHETIEDLLFILL